MIAAGRTRARPATPADLADVVRLEAAAFARPWSVDSLAQELARDDRLWFVAELDGDPPRTVGVAGVADLAGDAHVLSVAVDPSRRRRGHGAALVRALLAAAEERFGVRRATLEVRASNLAARALYRQLGFDEAGTRPGYYQDGEDAVVLWRDLVPPDQPDQPDVPGQPDQPGQPHDTHRDTPRSERTP